MRRLIDLNKFDGNTTVKELIDLLDKQEFFKTKEEESELQLLRNQFNNSYVKRFKPDTLFGDAIEVFHIKEITSQEKTIDDLLIYRFVGNSLLFSKKHLINKKVDIDRSFLKKEFDTFTKITETDYKNYIYQFNDIEKQLDNLIHS